MFLTCEDTNMNTNDFSINLLSFCAKMKYWCKIKRFFLFIDMVGRDVSDVNAMM